MIADGTSIPVTLEVDTMTKVSETRKSRRNFLKALGVSTGVGLAGCVVDDQGAADEEESIDEWGDRLVSHAEEADIDWQQFEGDSLVFGMNEHPFTELMENFIPEFEELTGISLEFQTFSEDELWQRVVLDLENESGNFDGFFTGLWPSAEYHYGDWVQDLNEFIEDPNLTDKEWLAMEDFPEGIINSLTYGEEGALVGMPFGVEAYGAVAYDEPTLDDHGIDPPETYEELLEAAQTIQESDETDRLGIASRASTDPLSTANWATLFRSYGADWIDYDEREALLDSDEGVASLEMFADLMSHGPSDIGSFDWYRSNLAMGEGDVAMCLHTPSAIGVWQEEQLERTEWLPPLPGPDGEQIAAPWTWSLGISEFSMNPEAAWLYIQFAISREANLLQSIRAWEGAESYGWAREGYVFDQEEWEEHGLKESWVEAHTQGLEMIPSNPPAVPLDTPQNMNIMSEAAIAMNAAVTGEMEPREALERAAPEITEYAENIPDEYIN